MTRKIPPTIEEICEECGYYHSERPEQAAAFHESHGIPLKVSQGRIFSQGYHQCAGCMRSIRLQYKYCIGCAKVR